MFNGFSFEGFELLKSYYKQYDRLFLEKEELIRSIKKAQENTIEKELVEVGKEVILVLEKIDNSSFERLKEEIVFELE